MRRYMGVAITAGLIALLFALVSQQGDADEEQVFEPAAVAGEDPISVIEEPDVIPTGWERLPDPAKKNSWDRAIAAVDGQVYLFGGMTRVPEDCTPWVPGSCEVEPLLDGVVFDESTSVWNSAASLPMPVSAGEMYTHQGALYARASCADEADCPAEAMLRYRVADDEWDVLSPIPGVTGELVSVGELLYAIQNKVQNFADVVWDEESASWKDLPTLPGGVELRDRIGVNIDGELVLIGTPVVPDRVLPAVGFRLRPESNDWVLFEIPRMSVCNVLTLGDDIFLISPKRRFAAGLRGARFVSGGGGWEALPRGPIGPVWDCDLGGIVGPDQIALNRTNGWFIDTATNQWTGVQHPFDEFDVGSSGTSATTLGRSVVVTGGPVAPEDIRPNTILLGTWRWTPP